MPDAILPLERAQVDARIAAGLYTVCSPGARSGVAWDDEPVPLREQIRRECTAAEAKAKARRHPRSPAVEQRRQRVARLDEIGLSIGEIVARSGLSRKTVENDLIALRRAELA